MTSFTEEERIVDLAEMIEAGLGRQVSQHDVRRFAEKQAGFEVQQVTLAERAKSKQISAETYVAELDKAMKELASEGEQILGFDDFHKVFGEFRVHNLFDPQVFIAEANATR